MWRWRSPAVESSGMSGMIRGLGIDGSLLQLGIAAFEHAPG
jgi:hypothetical protein